ncbi:ParB N-terminal domain-containing protein [Rhodobacteraceae bacterium M382]|nr:ParB N-terminal domain-containing protein [Rhodobacteraceae bacterium M382]
MRPARLIETTEIALADIDTSNRLRPVSQTAVEALVGSIEDLGLRDEIHVRKIKKSGKIRLIAGGHRVAAFQAMGRETIPAKVWDCTDDFAQLAEIDDNLAHAELDTLELSVFLARRKEVYERVYPETKHGGDRGNQHIGGRQTDILSFCQSVAEKRDVSERQIRRLVAAGQCLGPQEIRQLRDAPRKVTLADLQEIAKCSQPTDRYEICRALGDGSAKSAKEVMNRKKAPGAGISDPVEDFRIKLNDVFARASKEARRRFANDQRDILLELLGAPALIEDTPEPAEVVLFKSRQAQG